MGGQSNLASIIGGLDCYFNILGKSLCPIHVMTISLQLTLILIEIHGNGRGYWVLHCWGWELGNQESAVRCATTHAKTTAGMTLCNFVFHIFGI